MLTTDGIIRKLWDAQGYGNVAIWIDGSIEIVQPGAAVSREGTAPLAIFKPLPLVGVFPLLDYALADPGLRETIEKTIKDAGGMMSSSEGKDGPE